MSEIWTLIIIKFWDVMVNIILKLIQLKSWLNEGERWHDIGHVLASFFITTVFSMLTGIIWLGPVISMTYILIKEGLVDGFHSLDNLYDIGHFIFGSMLSISCILINSYYFS
jgi:hypothetical protein